MTNSVRKTIVLVLAMIPLAAAAEETIYSGFMSDYTQLEKVTDGSVDYRYLAPGAYDRLTQ